MIIVAFPEAAFDFDVETFFRVYEQNLQPAFEAIEGELRNITPDGATGDLGRAWAHTVKVNYSSLKHEGTISAQGKPAEYVEFVEYGRAPGKMPPWSDGSNLYEWAKRKITSANFKRTGKVMRKTEGREKVIASASYLIARSIAKHGTKPQLLLQKAFDEQKSHAEAIIEYAAHVAMQAAKK